MKTHPVSDEQLHAYIDGELDPAEARRVEAIIAASPELTLQVEQFRADKALIHRIYAPLIEQPRQVMQEDFGIGMFAFIRSTTESPSSVGLPPSSTNVACEPFRQ